MVRVDAFLFGYRLVKVDSLDVPKLVNMLLKLGINSDVRPNGEFILRERDLKRFSAYSAGRIRYSTSDTLGFLGLLKRLRRRKGIILAMLSFLVLYVVLSGMVWDVRVEGNERLEDSEIVAKLAENGFKTGNRWRKLDKNAIETNTLSDFAELSWISINRRGTVAYVKVIESENVGKKEETAPKYSNILADRDAVIEEITVVRGVALVKPGDVVRKGDVLISGVIEVESGTVFCRAEGSVKGQSVSTVSAKIPRNSLQKRQIKKSIYSVCLKIFNFSVNIFKNYGICANSYDIIKDVREYALFGKYRLPVTIEKNYRSEYEEVMITYDESELVEMAREKTNETVDKEFRDCGIAKMKSFAEWESDFYVMYTEVVYVTEIAEESAIEVS